MLLDIILKHNNDYNVIYCIIYHYHYNVININKIKLSTKDFHHAVGHHQADMAKPENTNNKHPTPM